MFRYYAFSAPELYDSKELIAGFNDYALAEFLMDADAVIFDSKTGLWLWNGLESDSPPTAGYLKLLPREFINHDLHDLGFFDDGDSLEFDDLTGLYTWNAESDELDTYAYNNFLADKYSNKE